MRITVTKMNTQSPVVRDLLAKARNAVSLVEAAHYTRQARIASKGSGL